MTQVSLTESGAAPSQQLRYALDQAASPFSPDFLCKSIAQADGPAEHWPRRRRILIAHEIALPFELHHVRPIGFRNRWLDPRILENLKRLRIEIGGEVGGVRGRFGEQRIIDADF